MRDHVASGPCLSPALEPPAPHHIGDRKIVAELDGWMVRAFPTGDRKFDYLRARGFLHLQLWHPDARVSVLTPSDLTDGLFEIFPVAGWKARTSAASVRALVAREHRVELLSLTRIAAITEWYVRGAERRAIEASRLRARTERRAAARDAGGHASPRM